MSKTNRDLMLALINKLFGGGPQGALICARYEREVLLPSAHCSSMYGEISDEEYNRNLRAMEPELPAFARFILDYRPGDPQRSGPPAHGNGLSWLHEMYSTALESLGGAQTAVSMKERP